MQTLKCTSCKTTRTRESVVYVFTCFISETAQADHLSCQWVSPSCESYPHHSCDSFSGLAQICLSVESSLFCILLLWKSYAWPLLVMTILLNLGLSLIATATTRRRPMLWGCAANTCWKHRLSRAWRTWCASGIQMFKIQVKYLIMILIPTYY